MPKVTQAHVEARRDQIIQAACKCFSENGFHRTTIRDICAEAGLSAGAVYGYFKSKDEIVEVMAEMGRRNTREALASGQGGTEGIPSLAGILDTVMQMVNSGDYRQSARLDLRLWGEGLHTPQLRKLFLEALASAMAPFAEATRQGQEHGEISMRLDPDAVARVCAALALGFTVQVAMDPEADLSGCDPVLAALLAGTFASRERP